MSGAPVQQPVALRSRPVTSLLGVGPERAALLSKLEIRTVEDLLLYRPRRYENREKLVRIADLELRQPAIVCGKVVALGTKWFRHHTKSIFELILEDGSARLHCRWWNLPYMEKYFAQGQQVLVFGKPLGLKPRTIDHPETEVLETGEDNFIHLNRITPIYGLTEGLGQRWLRALIWHTLQGLEAGIADPWPAALRLGAPGFEFPSRARAIHQIHFPETTEQAARARERLALDEFVELQCQIQARRRNFERKAQGLPCAGDNRLIKPLLKRLEFKLTAAQSKVLREIRLDLSGQHPMRRLLQGDVGSGKTVVAACSALMVLESGYEAVLMAPTEILAEQHFATFSRWFRPLGIPVALRTGSRKAHPPASNDSVPHAVPGSAHPKLTIGTHALIESGFQPERLGLVIIDEQHKFGVAQREQLLRKGCYPHLLVMTATPIPRTLGLTLYGDLDVSLIDQLPEGRGPIRTYVRSNAQLPKVWAFVSSRLAEGRQAYVIYPHIEEDEQSGIKAVTTAYETLREAFPGFKVAMMHGRLRVQEKEKVMSEFRQKQVQVLLATSMVEVGVDVPNATVMVIENAEQFGLAQLHQLRGRIGRGAHESFCILLTDVKTKNAQQRLRVLEETTDGFRIGEADLQLRGPGELLGQQQSGLPPFRFGDLRTDLELIHQARQIAAKLPVG
ncbi:MAG TPA: ATP-dependent DNA helicase RecG [Verrucomicrobiae bacterium]|nr:ATP-dependent DNA helicase RecG [Verrucomicrobiae bacterium]